MKTRYTYSTQMTLCFDDEFEMQFTGTLDDAHAKAEWAVGEYGFEEVVAIDRNTGEILFVMEFED